MKNVYIAAVSGAMEADSKKHPHIGVRAVQHKERLHTVYFWRDTQDRASFVVIRERLTYKQARRLRDKLNQLSKTPDELSHDDRLLGRHKVYSNATKEAQSEAPAAHKEV